MDKWSLRKLIIVGIIVGLAIGAILTYYKVKADPMIYLITLLIILIGLAVGFLYNMRQWREPAELMNEGEYTGAVRAYEDIHNRYAGRIGYRNQALIGIANCYNRMGQFDLSIDYLDKVEASRLDRNTRAIYYALYAHSLYFKKGNIEKAWEYVNRSTELLGMRETVLTRALIELELFGKLSAENAIKGYFNNSITARHVSDFYTILVLDEFSKQVNENFMLGLFYQKISDNEKAAKFLYEAAKYKHENYFTIEARRLVKNLYN